MKNHQKSLCMFFVTVFLFLLMSFMSSVFMGCQKEQPLSNAAADDTQKEENARGRFVESEISMPQEIEKILKFKQLSDGTLEVIARDSAYCCYLLKSSDFGENWESISLGTIAFDIAVIGEDGMAALIDFPENGVCPVNYSDVNGNLSQILLEVPDNDDYFIYAADLDSNGQLILRDSEGELYAVDCKDGERTVTFDTNGQYISYFQVIGTNCIAVTNEKVLLFDTTTGKQTEELSAITDLIKEDSQLMFRSSDKDFPIVFARGKGENGIIFADYKGVYHYSIGSSVSEQVILGEQTAFSSSGSGFSGIAMIDETHILLSGNNGMENAIYNYIYDEKAASVLNEELTVYSLEDTDTLRQAVSIFRQKYQDIYVNVEIGITQEDGITFDDALSSLSTDILAGNGPDVLILDGMSLESYIEKGILTDISDIADEIQQTDGLIESIVEDSKKDGKIYAIPTRFLVSVIVSDEETTEAGSSLKTLADRADVLDAENKTRYVVQEQIAENLLLSFYHADSANWKKENGSLDEEKIANYLTQAKRIYDIDDHSRAEEYEQYIESGISIGYRFGSFDYTEVVEKLSRIGLGTIADAADFQTILSINDVSWKMFDTQENTAYVPFLEAGVLAGGNEQAAKEFIKILLGKEAGAAGNGIPVNKSALKEQVEKLQQPTETVIAFGTNESDEIYQIEYRSLTQEETDRIIAQLESVTKRALTDRTIQNVVIEQGKKYLKEEQSLEDTLDAIIKKVNLYLAE